MSNKLRSALAALALVGLLAPAALACLWDNDTLQMERLRFPGVLEIITGKFVRHSRAYYEWRITDRLEKLEAKPDDPALMDDLAVGYDKLGRYDEGIAVLEKSLAAHPDRYETLANLATLLFHAGRLEESKQHVQRALKINPNAHFGREKYQLLLTDYVLQSELKSTGVLSSDEKFPAVGGGGVRGFARFVIASKYGEDKYLEYSYGRPESEAELQNAGKGVLGMLHFADHESPILLEALGDLLITGELDKNGTRLAARAYVRAAQLSQDAEVADRLRLMARQALANQLPYSPNYDAESVDLLRLESELAEELKQGTESFATIEAKEQHWIANGANVDREFAAVYYDSLDETIATAMKQMESEPPEPRPGLAAPRLPAGLVVMSWLIPAVLILAVVSVGTIGFIQWRRRRGPSTVEVLPK